jgi:PAS domain S-box-containing protein
MGRPDHPMHEADILRVQIERLGTHLAGLSDRAAGAELDVYPLVHESLAELQTALEEMRVSEEEMRAASEELAAAQVELAAQRQRYHDLFHFAPDACLVTDPMGVIREANRAAGALLGVDPSRLAGKPLPLYVGEDDRRGFRGALAGLARGEAPGAEVEVTVLPRHGPPVRVGFRAAPLADADGRVCGALCSLRDLTERLRAEEHERQLAAERIARAEAERANRVKSDFLAVMSHELRTPLTSIMAYTELLQMGIPAAVPDAVQPHLGCIEEASRHLLRLIEEILGFARLEAGREEVHAVEVDLRELADETLAFIHPLADKRGLRVDVSLPEGPLPAHTDRAKARQVLINLLSNAVKFTPRGSVALSLEPGAPGEALFRVSDTGVGLSPEHLERIFEPFWQAEQGTTRAVSGTGLGLSIAQHVARMLGGDLVAGSRPGEGTVITFHLPLRLPPPS